MVDVEEKNLTEKERLMKHGRQEIIFGVLCLFFFWLIIPGILGIILIISGWNKRMKAKDMKMKKGVEKEIKKEKYKDSFNPRWIVIIGFVIFIAVFAGCTLMILGDNKPKDTKDIGIDACYKAREIIINYLKTPKTAEFQSCYDANIIITKYTNFTLYTVNSYVDSQNSFGAMLRMNFNVKFEDLGDGQLTFINWEEL